MENKLERQRSILKDLSVGAVLLACVVFLLNLTFGVVEIPDNLPFVGNIDEVIASALLFKSLDHFGIRIPFLSRRKEETIAAEPQ